VDVRYGCVNGCACVQRFTGEREVDRVFGAGGVVKVRVKMDCVRAKGTEKGPSPLRLGWFRAERAGGLCGLRGLCVMLDSLQLSFWAWLRPDCGRAGVPLCMCHCT